MAAKIVKTNFPGVRYREHPTRRHGVNFDRYFFIRYKLNGKDREEALGWGSEGMTAQKASHVLSVIKENHRIGNGPQSLEEMRQQENERREVEQAEREQLEKEKLTFGQFFRETYFPQAKADKSERSYNREDQLFKLWIGPVIADQPLKMVCPLHLERIKKRMSDSGRAPRSIQYALAVIRQVFNYARRLGIFQGDNPVSKVKKPSIENKRIRFLSHEEADVLLSALRDTSKQVYEMALMSLHCGLRAGEVFALTWGCVDFGHGALTLLDTKSRDRVVYMTQQVREMLLGRERGQPSDLVFPARGGGKIEAISKTFDKVVEAVGLNDGILDARQKVCFHTLRHTFASWHVQNGTDLYVVQKLLGHSTLTMTQRYAHLAPDTLRKATDMFDNSLKNQDSVSRQPLHLTAS